MVADLREIQENQWVSENRIDKSGFIYPCNFKRCKSRVYRGKEQWNRIIRGYRLYC